MILLLSIILFIIFLIYSIKPRGEGYTLEGLKLSWTNKANIEDNVTKWIITLKDSSGNVIHTYENSDANNLKDFTDVTMNIVDKKEFDEKIIGDNILELYYNEVKPNTKLYTKTVTFTQNDFGYIIDTSKLEEVGAFTPKSSGYTYAKSIWFGYENSSWNNRPLNIAEIEVYSGGVNVTTKDNKTESSSQYSSNNFKPKNLIDGNMSNFAHTNNSGTNWFKITLDKHYPIEKVMVYNRTSCCFSRWASSFVKLLDDNGNQIVSSIEKIPDDTGLATNYKEGGVRVKTFTFPETFTYELIMNKKNASTLGIHVEYIKLDGVLATKAQTTIHKNPNRNNKPDNMFSVGSGTENFASWNANGHNVGDKIFTIVSDKKVDKIDIAYTRPLYAPGWIIKENGVTKITETSNRGNNSTPRPVVYTYDIKNGKSSPFTIPYQIARATDGWCGHTNSVHQDVPGCGRLCSDVNGVGSKNKNTWGSWDKYPGSVDCPAAKLDEVYQFLNGKRSLRVGNPSFDLTGGFKWYYYKGSYFSDTSSFSGKTPTKQGDNVTDFSSKHKATSGHLRNDGNEDNYAVKWEGFFVPKKTGSHKFWTESDDMSYLTINGVVVIDNGGLHGMVKAPKDELNPPERSRKYSSVYSDQSPGVGHARSMLDSDQAWSAAHNVVDQWMEIDMGANNFIAGVVVQGRKGSTQRVTSFVVSIDGKTITSTLKYTSSKDTRQTYTFSNPVIGRKVRFIVKGWNSHASMRAGVIPAKSVNLKAGQKYPIKIYFSEKSGGDELKVWFQGPGMSSATHDFSGYMLK